MVFQRFIAVSVYLPHKYIIGKTGDDFFLALCEYQRVLREVALAVQSLKTTYRVKDVVLGVDAQVEVEAEVFHEQWPVTGPAVDGTSQVPRGPTGGFERLAHEYCQAFSEAITTTIGLLGLTMCNTFGGARVPTWRSTKYIPDGQTYQHVYDYICIPRAWTLPQATVVWPVPREARDRRKAETYWSDHAVVSVPLPAGVQPESKRGRRKERSNTHWICQETALAPLRATLESCLLACDRDRGLLASCLSPGDVGDVIVRTATTFGEVPRFQDTLPRVSEVYVSLKEEWTSMRRR